MRRQADELRRSIRDQSNAQREIFSSLSVVKDHSELQNDSVGLQLAAVDEIIAILEGLDPMRASFETGADTLLDGEIRQQES
jgi:hypothetical protein